MSNHNFKVGDKVKLRNPKQFSIGGGVFTISHFEGKFIIVNIPKNGGTFPLVSCEIESAVKVGEQLQFSFMEGD